MTVLLKIISLPCVNLKRKKKKKKVKCTKRKACVSGGNTGVVLLLSLNMNLCEQDMALGSLWMLLLSR